VPEAGRSGDNQAAFEPIPAVDLFGHRMNAPAMYVV
jgi:hypothetical protein